ncbi:MAG: hypothetical protein ABIM99_06545 [Candidatus Dojkabacteria bacterium]
MVIIVENDSDTMFLFKTNLEIDGVDLNKVMFIKNNKEFQVLVNSGQASEVTAAFIDHDLSPQFDTPIFPVATGGDILGILKLNGYSGKTYTISAYGKDQEKFIKERFGDPEITVIPKTPSNSKLIIESIKKEVENEGLKMTIK